MYDVDAAAARTTLGAFAASGVSGYGATLIDDADAAAARATLGISTYGSSLIDDADAAAARTTLGLTPTTGTSTPTPTSVPGTLTSASSSLSYEKVGTRVRLTGTVSVTTAGTGAGELRCAIPFSCGSVPGVSGNAREIESFGVGCTVVIPSSSTYLSISKTADGGTIIANNVTVLFEITYDAAS